MDEVEFTLSHEFDDSGVDEDLDSDLKQEVNNRLDNGDELAWCRVIMTAKWKSYSASESIGGCILTDDYTVEQCANDHELKQEALDKLNKVLKDHFNNFKHLIL